MADWFDASFACAVTDAAIVINTHRTGMIILPERACIIKAIKPLTRAAITVAASSCTPYPSKNSNLGLIFAGMYKPVFSNRNHFFPVHE